MSLMSLALSGHAIRQKSPNFKTVRADLVSADCAFDVFSIFFSGRRQHGTARGGVGEQGIHTGTERRGRTAHTRDSQRGWARGGD